MWTNLFDWLAFWFIIGSCAFLLVFAGTALVTFIAAFAVAFWRSFRESLMRSRQ